jgi:hypothetical protein
VGRSIGQEPFLISYLVRIAIGGVAMKSAQRILALGEPSDEALARLQADLLIEMDQPLLLYGMKGERATLDEIIRRIADQENPISSLSGSSSFDDRVPAMSSWGKLMFDSQRAVGLEWSNRLVAAAKAPPWEQPPLIQAWKDDMDRVRTSRFGVYVTTIPLLMMPAYDAASMAHLRYEASLGSMAILLAAERQRRKTGSWPDSVDAIGRNYLEQAPRDPASGRPFRMKHEDGQYVVYSVGPNLIDDAGIFQIRLWPKGLDDVNATGWDVTLRRQIQMEE